MYTCCLFLFVLCLFNQLARTEDDGLSSNYTSMLETGGLLSRLSRLLACRRRRSSPAVADVEMMRKARATASATTRHARAPAIDEPREISRYVRAMLLPATWGVVVRIREVSSAVFFLL